MAPPSKHPGAARQSRSPHRLMPLPSKHPGGARRSRNRNARKLSPIYATGNMERVGGKTQKTADCKEKRSARRNAACPNPLDEGEKKTRKESADALDPEKYPVPYADGSPMSHPCYRRHSATPPQSYPSSRRATSTQARVAIWAATLAPSQAGTRSICQNRYHQSPQNMLICARFFGRCGQYIARAWKS